MHSEEPQNRCVITKAVFPTWKLHYTSTASNYYTGLIETSKTHFYGRAAAELSFSEGILRTFTGVREAFSFSHCNTTCSVSPNMSYSARKNMKARAACVLWLRVDANDSAAGFFALTPLQSTCPWPEPYVPLKPF